MLNVVKYRFLIVWKTVVQNIKKNAMYKLGQKITIKKSRFCAGGTGTIIEIKQDDSIDVHMSHSNVIIKNVPKEFVF